MKAFTKFLASMGIVGLAVTILCSATNASNPTAKTFSEPTKDLNIRIVDFKLCVEKSKVGKQEQASFEALKKQMEGVLEEKEKNLSEIAAKFNDPDYLDSLSHEAEAELKHKYRNLNQELSLQQNQYYQALNQTNYKVLQKLNDIVSELTAKYAKENHIDLVLNEESFYYHAPELNITDKIIFLMDEKFDKDSKETKPLEAIES